MYGVGLRGMMGCVESPTSSSEARISLTALFEDHFDAVFAFCLLRSGSRTIAEEVASDVFADAVRTYRRDTSVVLTRGWLVAVARRRLVDHWRQVERNRRRIERVALLRPDEPADPTDVDDGVVMSALASLSNRQRLALVLRYLDELSVSEVADMMDMSYRATESLLSRARRSFARSYAEQSRASEEAP